MASIRKFVTYCPVPHKATCQDQNFSVSISAIYHEHFWNSKLSEDITLHIWTRKTYLLHLLSNFLNIPSDNSWISLLLMKWKIMAIIAICFLGAEFKYDDGFSIFDLSFKKSVSVLVYHITYDFAIELCLTLSIALSVLSLVSSTLFTEYSFNSWCHP